MKDLIEALQIFLKYKNERWPTYCGHEVLYIMGVTKDEVSKEDQERLEHLGFFWGNGLSEPCWQSFRYGNA